MKLRSYTISQGRDRAPARAMLKAIGLTDADLAKPIIGVANTWIETMPCNYNLRELAVKVKEGIRAAGGTPMEFNTVAISDGVTMGTEGMKASLVSREVVADSIELVARGHMFDALVVIVGCDKTIPGGAMALLRLNIPGVILYSGAIMPGRFRDRDDLTIVDSDRISRTTPLICDLKPGGRYVAVDLDRAGGTQFVAKRLIDGGKMDPSCVTVTGRTIGEEAASARETPGQRVVLPLEEPIK